MPTNCLINTPQEIIDEARGRLRKAQAHLLMNSPFIAFICLNLVHEFTEAVPTAGTNGVKVMYNPKFFVSLTPDEQVFVVAHEIWHVGLDHFTRVGDRDRSKWNQAGDYVINGYLKKHGFFLPKGALHEPQYDGMMTEQVYDLLPDHEDGEDPVIGYDVLDPPEDLSPSEFKTDIDTKLVQAKQAVEKLEKDIGSIPGEALRIIDDIVNPKLPWYVILRNWMTDWMKDDYTWTRPNKRFQPDFYLPSQRSPGMKTLSIVTDVSGSISFQEFTGMLSEIQGIKDLFQPEKMELVLHDTKITNIIDLTDREKVNEHEFIGGGGTDITDVVRHYNENPPQLVIWFTDLQFVIPSEKPLFPIIWICTGGSDAMPADWGETIYM